MFSYFDVLFEFYTVLMLYCDILHSNTFIMSNLSDSGFSYFPITTQRISPASAGGGFYLSAQSEYNLRLSGSDSTNRLCLLKAEL